MLMDSNPTGNKEGDDAGVNFMGKEARRKLMQAYDQFRDELEAGIRKEETTLYDTPEVFC